MKINFFEWYDRQKKRLSKDEQNDFDSDLSSFFVIYAFISFIAGLFLGFVIFISFMT